MDAGLYPRWVARDDFLRTADSSAFLSTARIDWTMRSFKHPLEPGEIGGHGISVARKVLIAHTREPAQREHHLTAASVGNHPHRVVNDLTRGQRDVVIEDTVFIALNEREADPAHRGLHEPSLTYLLDGAPEPGGPPRQVGRVRGVVVNLICGTVDPLADVPRSRSHGATMPDATDIAIAQEPRLLALKASGFRTCSTTVPQPSRHPMAAIDLGSPR